MNRNRYRAITLMELLIALVLFVMVGLGIANIEIFCRNVFTGSDRKAKVINQAGYLVEHMSKFIGGAVGDAVDIPVTVETSVGSCTKAVKVWVDYDPGVPPALNGIKDAGDRQIMYCYDGTADTVTYYPNYVSAASASEVLVRNIADFNVTFVRNTVDINITACWNTSTSSAQACGTVDNPRQTLQTRIVMPSVSIEATP
jgi:hypothetical protein